MWVLKNVCGSEFDMIGDLNMCLYSESGAVREQGQFHDLMF